MIWPTARWLVTIRLDPERTRDVGHDARNSWHARWLHATLHPSDLILAVRPAHR
jgi:hypothetical protein